MINVIKGRLGGTGRIGDGGSHMHIVQVAPGSPLIGNGTNFGIKFTAAQLAKLMFQVKNWTISATPTTFPSTDWWNGGDPFNAALPTAGSKLPNNNLWTRFGYFVRPYDAGSAVPWYDTRAKYPVSFVYTTGWGGTTTMGCESDIPNVVTTKINLNTIYYDGSGYYPECIVMGRSLSTDKSSGTVQVGTLTVMGLTTGIFSGSGSGNNITWSIADSW